MNVIPRAACALSSSRPAFLALAVAGIAAWPNVAAAYIGDSFLSIPGESGHWRGSAHKGWIRIEMNNWQGRLMKLNSGPTDFLAGDKLYFGGPNAPSHGNGGKLAVVLGKSNPDLPKLMQLCKSKAVLPELAYAESSDLARPALELGARPADLPAFWEYRLKDAQITNCPVLEGARDQALIIAFKAIEWLNYNKDRPLWNRITVKPQEIPNVRPAVATARKQVRSYLVTWLAPAATTTEKECPVYNGEPLEADVFRYLTPEEIAATKAKFSPRKIVYGVDSERRGPERMSVAMFPGIVPDPGQHEPNTTVSFGMDLDGDDGTGKPPPGIRKHGNFTSPDGRRGIDNQYLRVVGCIPGYRGRLGFANHDRNARRSDGNIVTLIEVSDVDDARNDGSVEVAMINSMDKAIKDPSGKIFVPWYSFRPSEDPNFALYNAKVRGHIVNGVIETDPVERLDINPGQGALIPLHKARFRIEPQPDGSAKIYLAGYLPWKPIAFGSGYSEGLMHYQTDAMYYAYRRFADGLYDPLTKEYDGISITYEIDTVAAFLTPLPVTAEKAPQGKPASGQSR